MLDVVGPLAKIFDLAEEAAASNVPVDTETLRGWIQRAICFIGNANVAFSTERRRAVLIKIDPQLSNIANKEPGPSVEGKLFGESFIKEIGNYVGVFNSLHKARTPLNKNFGLQIFGQARKSRGHFPGRSSVGRGSRGFSHAQSSSWIQPNPSQFFPNHGRP